MMSLSKRKTAKLSKIIFNIFLNEDIFLFILWFLKQNKLLTLYKLMDVCITILLKVQNTEILSKLNL